MSLDHFLIAQWLAHLFPSPYKDVNVLPNTKNETKMVMTTVPFFFTLKAIVRKRATGLHAQMEIKRFSFSHLSPASFQLFCPAYSEFFSQ